MRAGLARRREGEKRMEAPKPHIARHAVIESMDADLGDVTTLAEPAAVEEFVAQHREVVKREL